MIIGAGYIVVEPGIADKVFPTYEPCPSAEHRLADRRDDNPSVPDAVYIARGGVVAGIPLLRPPCSNHCSFGKQWHHKSNAGCEQRDINDLPATSLFSFVEGQQRAKGPVQRGAIVFE